MIAGFKHLKSKRYWALILLGPLVRIVFAYSVFAGLHLGFGLPWPKLEDAGLVGSLLEVLGLMVLLIAVDHLVLGWIYGRNFFRSGWFSRKQDMGVAEILCGIPGMTLGYAIVLKITDVLSMQAVADFNNAGFTVWLVTFVSMLGFLGTVKEGERLLLAVAEDTHALRNTKED